jgi:hypothetical protein
MFRGELEGAPPGVDHEGRRAIIAEAILNRIRRMNHMEIDDKSIRNLRLANEALKTGSLVIYANHVNKTDALLLIPLGLSLPDIKKVMGPVAKKHYDFRRDPFGAAMFRMLRVAGLYPMPVVQPNDTDSYSAEQKQRMSERLRQKTAALLGKPGTLYGIIPEGTRTHDGILRQARTGIGFLESSVGEEGRLTYLPVGLVYPHMGDAEINVGSPFRLNELMSSRMTLPEDPKARARHITDSLMVELAALLPEASRGAYSEPERFL